MWISRRNSLMWNKFMMTSSNGNIFRVTGHLCGKFPTQRPVTRSFEVFFDLRSTELLSKQSWGWWLETLSSPLWRHRNVYIVNSKAHGWLFIFRYFILIPSRKVPPIYGTRIRPSHYTDVIMTTMTSQITSLAVVYSNVYSDVDQRKHQSSASLTFARGIHRDRWIPRTKGQ